MNILKIKKLNEKAKEPIYATPGSAGLDLSACIDNEVTLPPLGRELIPTGIAIKIPEGYAGFIFGRSGLGIKNGITLSNSVGVIDSDYTGEIKIGLINLSHTPYTIRPGDRIAQLVIMPYIKCQLLLCDELDKTERGEGGFGSTGK